MEFAEFLDDIRLMRTPAAGLRTQWPCLAISNGSMRFPDMIIIRSPLRITLGGGGTDLPSYYREHDGFLVAAAIDNMSMSR